MYNNNPSLRGPEEKVNMTEHRMAEWLKCQQDILYFAETYCTITTIDDGKIKIPLRHYQKKMLKAMHEPANDKKHIIVNSARQIGKCFFSDTLITIKNKKTGVVREISIEDFYNIVKTQN